MFSSQLTAAEFVPLPNHKSSVSRQGQPKASLLECLVILAAAANVTVHGVVYASSTRVCERDIPDNAEWRPRPSRAHPHPGSTCNIVLRPPTVAREPCGPANILLLVRVIINQGFRALFDFSGVIVTAWHRPPSPSLPPSRPRCPSLPPGVRIHKQHIRLAPFASGQRCKPVSSNTCSSYRAREAAPPRLPRRPTTTATTPSALLAMLAFLYGASSRASTAVEMEVERRAQMGSDGARDLDVCVCSCILASTCGAPILASTKLELGMGVEKTRVHRTLALGESRIGDGGVDGVERMEEKECPCARNGMRMGPGYGGDVKVCRILLGLGVGTKASTVPVFTAANTLVSIRDGLVISWQLWVNTISSNRTRAHQFSQTAFGILLGFCANLALDQVGRVMEVAARLRVPLCCPANVRSLPPPDGRLRNTELQAARDLYYVHRQLMELAVLQGVKYLTRFFELFTIPRMCGMEIPRYERQLFREKRNFLLDDAAAEGDQRGVDRTNIWLRA
ncbi:hypothetical protein B0H13DRAFT_2417765 [Mycena leptocephala]|nr:hypothetical protein B0H13DRAFT_2417765 [Mycena leptocephala]